MLVDRLLDDARIDVVAAGEDHVLDAVDDLEVALRVHTPMSPVRKKPSGVVADAVSSGRRQ